MSTPTANWPTGDDDADDALPPSAPPVAVVETVSPATATTRANPPVVAPVVVPLKPGGPTLKAFIAAGYKAENYPPFGFAAVADEPETIQEAIAAMKAADALPNRTAAEHAKRHAAVVAAAAVYHRLCNGPALVPMTGADLKELQTAQGQAARHQLLVNLGRQHPVVKELVAENDELKALLKLAK